MPKVLIYMVKKVMWVFLFYNTDQYENRAHVHVGKKGSQRLCKIWLEPNVEVDKIGEFTDAQIEEILELAKLHLTSLMKQWAIFKDGKKVKPIKITK